MNKGSLIHSQSSRVLPSYLAVALVIGFPKSLELDVSRSFERLLEMLNNVKLVSVGSPWHSYLG